MTCSRFWGSRRMPFADEPLAVNPVDPGSSVAEHGGALSSRVACGQPFECVVHNIVGIRHLIDWSR